MKTDWRQDLRDAVELGMLELERLEDEEFLDWCDRTSREEDRTPTSEPRSGERHESPLGPSNHDPIADSIELLCDSCDQPIPHRRTLLGYRICLACAEASHVPYRADSATTRDGQILELVLHRTAYQNGVRLGGATALLSLAR